MLVTGATSGIGLSAAVAFARLGASVRILARDQARAEQARDQIAKAASGDVEVAFDLADVSDFDALRAVCDTVRRGQRAAGRAGAQRGSPQRRLPPGYRRH